MKYVRKLMFLLAISFLLILIPHRAAAEDDLYIPEWVVEAHLLENGDLQISEDITFEFNTDFNGVYRDIILNKTSGVAVITVQEVDGNNIKDYSLVKAADNGDSGVYILDEDNKRLLVKIYSPSEDEEKTFRISYLVKNVAVRYNDTGELYYKFLGAENETSIGNFTVNINLPQANSDNNIRFFVHGPAGGKTSKKSDTLYQLQLQNVSSGTFVEGRLLFPKEFIAVSVNYKDIDKYSEIVEEETALQRKNEEKAARRESSRKLFNQISLLGSGIAAVIFIYVMYRCRRNSCQNIYQSTPDSPQNSVYLSQARIPQDCTPAIASLITGQLAGSNVIFATILDLFRKGYLRINGEQSDESLTGNQSFVIIKIKETDASLLKHERYFIHWLLSMGEGNTVSTRDIEYYSKHSSASFINSYTTWKNNVKLDAKEQGYYEKSKAKYGIILGVLTFVLFLLGISTSFAGSLFGILNFIIAVITFISALILANRLSDYGYDQYRKWISFRKYMKKLHPDLTEEEALNSLDLSLIYAMALNVVKKLSHIPQAENNYELNSWVLWYILFVNTDNNTFKKSIDNSFHAIDASSYSDGGFSAGGGGGAGGGGAGGF